MSQKTPHNSDQDIELNNAENSGQIGQAGRDLVQIGRDYIQYIYNNSRSGNWGAVAVALIPLFLFLFGVKAGADKVAETFGAKPSTADPASVSKPTSSLSTSPNPTSKDFTQPVAPQSSEFQFPQDSCGDKSTDSNNTWYPVFVNGGNLDEIQQKYCKDAINATRQTGEKAIQVASFTSGSKAQRFAKAVGGEVGEPRQPKPTASLQASPSPESKPSIAVTSPSNSNATEAKAKRQEAERLAAEQAAARDQAARDQAARDQAARDQAARDQAARDQAAQRLAAEQAAAKKRAEAEARRRDSMCILTITNSLVSLSSEPQRQSQELIRVRPGEYIPVDYTVTSFGGLRNDGWFLIEAEGRRGWIRDDTWTINSKTRLCQ
jgi:chemotaxis protein histidine kinase CheA